MSNRNRTAGHNAERQIVNELKKLGFDKVVTTRLESKRLDDLGVDIIQLPNPTVKLPCYIQVKKCLQTPNFSLLNAELEKPLVLVFQKTEKKGKRFYTVNEYTILKKDFFYELLKYYVYNQCSRSEDIKD